MQSMHEALERAEQALADMKEQMEASARHYIQQQATVFELADALNKAALNAENTKGNEPQGDEQGKSDATET